MHLHGGDNKADEENSGKAPNQHTTDKAASPAEIYKITVRYTPVTSGAAETYENTTAGGKAGKVTAGTGNDEVKSENEHKINVIKKGLGIEKVDEDGAKITEYNATFKLFRPVTAGETGSSVTGLPAGTYKEIAALTTNAGTAVLSNALEELRKLPDGQHYYLVETQEPTGYQKLSGPVQVDVSVTPGPQTKPYEQSEGITTLINIGRPAAAISFSGDGVTEGTHSENTFVLKITNKAATVDISIHKTDDQHIALPGATFKLMNGSQIVSVSAEGTGVLVLPKDSDESVTISDNTFTIPAGGVSIQNIPISDKVYSIVEVDAPDGYVITNNTPSTFKVTGGQVTDEQHIEGVIYNPETMDFVIPNYPGVELPATGGSGISIFYLLGIMLISLAGAGLVMERRRRNAA